MPDMDMHGSLTATPPKFLHLGRWHGTPLLIYSCDWHTCAAADQQHHSSPVV